MIAIFVVVVAGLIGAALSYTSATARMGNRSRDMVPAQALAEGALELAFKRWQIYMVRTGGSQIPAASDLAGTTIINPTDLMTKVNALPNHDGFTLRNIVVTPVDREDNPVTDAAPLSSTRRQQISSRIAVPGQPGWSGVAFSFRATATVSSDYVLETGTPLQITVSRYFQKIQSSLFQAMLFFQDDLELHPGPQMTLYGLVHTNANLYAAAGTSGSLTFASNVSFTGNPAALNTISIDTVDSRGYVEGVTATLAQQEAGNWSSFNPPQYQTNKSSQLSQVAALDPLGTAAQATLPASQQNNNTSGLHELIERPVMSQSDPAVYATHRIYGYAGLRISINRKDATQPIHVYQPDTTDPTWASDYHTDNSTEIVPAAISNKSLPKGATPAPPNIADQIISTIAVSAATAAPTAGGGSTGKGDIMDFREGREVNLDTIDVSKLTPVLNAYSSYNGVLYVSDITNADSNLETSNVDAIRLKKGGVLPNQGMTVVSDGAVYVQGDYNTGTTYKADLANGAVGISTQPVSNTGADPTKYTVTGYTQKPASIMGDAVMILSNAWTDANGHQALSNRVATPTTFNAAVLSGQVITDPTTGKASGGAHNFPRFLENWSGDNLTYYGSMVELYQSKHWKGAYGSGNVYSPPNRRWFFDTTYLTTPPPGSVTSTTYSRGRWVPY